MKGRSAFTLIEILIVVIILGILAAAIIPQFTSAADDGRTNSTAIMVRSMTRKVSVESAKNGSFPATITADMFEGSTLPRSPLFPSVTDPQFEVETNKNLMHPATKTGSGDIVWWYNNGNGIVRALIPDEGTNQEKIDKYNAVNNTNITKLGQTK